MASYCVYRRPHLAAFLDYCFGNFKVAVWTSASRDYAYGIASKIMAIDRLAFLWVRERCTPRRDYETGEIE